MIKAIKMATGGHGSGPSHQALCLTASSKPGGTHCVSPCEGVCHSPLSTLLTVMPEKSNLEFKRLSCVATQIPLRGMTHLQCVQSFGFKSGKLTLLTHKGKSIETSIIMGRVQASKSLFSSHCYLQTSLFRVPFLIPGNNLGRSDPVGFLLLPVLMKCHLQA